MGEEAEFLGATKGAFSGIRATIKILKRSMEAAQEIIPSLEAESGVEGEEQEAGERQALWPNGKVHASL